MSAIDIIPVCMLHMRSLIIRLSFLYICVLLIVFLCTSFSMANRHVHNYGKLENMMLSAYCCWRSHKIECLVLKVL